MVAGHLQQKNGRWYAVLNVIDDAGKRKPKWIATHLPVKGNKKRAEEMLTQLRIQYTGKEDIQRKSGGIYFNDYMTTWLNQMENQVSPTTYASYRNVVLNSICPYFKTKEILLQDLKPVEIDGYYEYLRQRGNSNNTILHHHANIRKALQSAFRKELIATNPADRVERPKTTDFIANPYSAEECRELLRAVQGEKLELVVALTLYLGLRRSEVLGLRWGSINFERDTVTINHTLNHVSIDGKYTTVALDKVKRNASYRTLPLTEPLRSTLHSIWADKKPSPSCYVCTDKNGHLIKPNYVSQVFPKLLERHELRPIRFHDIRHSTANLLIGERVPLIEVQQWLGHSTISTTADLYSHLDFATKLNSAETIKKI